MQEMEPTSEEGWTKAIDRNLQLWVDNLDRTKVIEHDGTAVGYEMWAADTFVATLITMNVSANYRHQGLGARLLQQFQSDASAERMRELRLGVHRANPARRLYEAAGYQLTGEDGDYLLYSSRIPEPHGSDDQRGYERQR